jgi:O-antigen ligase
MLLGVIAFAAYSPLGEPGTDSVVVDRRLSDTTLVSRLDLWSDGLTLLPEEAASGIGIGGFEQITFFDPSSTRKDFSRVHNTYLTIIVELGLVGVVAFSLLAVAVARSVRSGFIGGSRDQRWRIAAVIACVVGLLAFSVWVDALYQRHLWILMALALAAPQRNESDVEGVVPVDARK